MAPEVRHPSPEDQAQNLKSELEAAYHGVRVAVANLAAVQYQAAEFLDERGLVPPPEEGLDEPFHDLYQLWRNQPDADELEDKI